MAKITCIYKITSPSGKIYIGQTINFKRRIADYRSKKAYKQPYLNASFNKYGVDAHKFEILHELPNDVTQTMLNDYEVLYMQQFRDCGFILLNLKEGGSNGRNSDESIKKANEKWMEWYKKNPDGLRASIEKSIAARKGKPLSEEHKKKVSLSSANTPRTKEWRDKISKAHKGKKVSQKVVESSRERMSKMAGMNKRSIKQYSMNDDFIKEWPSATEAERLLGIAHSRIIGCCLNKRGYKSAGGFKWKYANDQTL